MKKIAVVCQSSQSNWISCRSITKNLVKSYELAFPDAEFRVFHIGKSMSFYQVYSEAGRLCEFSPDLVSFIDHEPHPGLFMKCVAERFKGGLPRFVVHVFGDFMLKPAEWIEVTGILKATKTRFVCASEKQAKLVSSLIQGPEHVVNCIPFPVDFEEYAFSPKLYEAVRREYGYNPSGRPDGQPDDQPDGQKDGWIFLYSGRLSLQKNVLLLIKAFASYLKQVNTQAHLWLSGPIDDLGVPYLGKSAPPGLLAFDLMNLIRDAIPAELVDHVRYWGDLEAEKLKELYHAADCYVSFSTHNDEDFGMAPAEALACGCPVLLTDWGGYSSFKHVGGHVAPESCRLVPVRIGKDKVAPDIVNCLKGLVGVSSHRSTPRERTDISASARMLFSRQSVAENLKNMIDGPSDGEFRSFSSLFSDVAGAYKLNPDAPFSAGKQYSGLYKELYGSYA